MSYDTWKTTEPDWHDPGRGPAKKPPMLYCTECKWRGGFPAACDHQRVAGHVIASKKHGIQQLFDSRTRP